MTASPYAHAAAPSEDGTRSVRPGARTRNRTRFTALAAASLLAVAAPFAAASPALAHDELVGYEVIASDSDGTVTGFALHFNNEILDVGAEIRATDHHGESVTDGAAIVSGRDVTQALLTPLDADEYDIVWRVVSSDGHPISGALELTIAADGNGTLAVAEPGESDSGEHSSEEGEHSDEDAHSHDHDDAAEASSGSDADASSEGGSGFSTAAVVGILIGALAVAGAAIAAVIGARRRARAVTEAAQAGRADAAGDAPSSASDGDAK